MDDLDVGCLVRATLSVGVHPAIVLSTREEIKADGKVRVVGISANATISLPEDLIEVPRGLGMKKKCFVQCALLETLPENRVESLHRKAWGQFLVNVRTQVKVAANRVKKSTQS